MAVTDDGAPDSSGALETRNLVRRFGKFTALDGLNLRVEAGAAFGLIGNNGSGKTTAIHSLMGFLPPSSGEVRVLGSRPSLDTVGLRQRIGFFAEREQPFGSMRVEQVLKLGSLSFAQWDRAYAETLRERYYLDPRKRIKQLSKGQVAKVKLILALAHAPECLILDEPTSGLDPGSRNELLSMVVEMRRRKGTTTLFCSHNLDDVADISTHIGILHLGRMLFSASVDHIRDRMAKVRFAPGTAPVPPARLQDQVVSVQSRDQATEWLIADRDDVAMRSFLAEVRPMELRTSLAVKEVFLSVTAAAQIQHPATTTG